MVGLCYETEATVTSAEGMHIGSRVYRSDSGELTSWFRIGAVVRPDLWKGVEVTSVEEMPVLNRV